VDLFQTSGAKIYASSSTLAVYCINAVCAIGQNIIMRVRVTVTLALANSAPEIN